jgi:hypothetical protein
MMAYLDLTGGKRVLVCDEDSRPFVSGAYQARSCSGRCRNRALKRAYRERHRDREADPDDLQRTSAWPPGSRPAQRSSRWRMASRAQGWETRAGDQHPKGGARTHLPHARGVEAPLT